MSMDASMMMPGGVGDDDGDDDGDDGGNDDGNDGDSTC